MDGEPPILQATSSLAVPPMVRANIRTLGYGKKTQQGSPCVMEDWAGDASPLKDLISMSAP